MTPTPKPTAETIHSSNLCIEKGEKYTELVMLEKARQFLKVGNIKRRIMQGQQELAYDMKEIATSYEELYNRLKLMKEACELPLPHHTKVQIDEAKRDGVKDEVILAELRRTTVMDTDELEAVSQYLNSHPLK